MSTETHQGKSAPQGTDNHGHEKQVTIVVNGREKAVTAKELSFAEIVALAFPNANTDANATYTITFRKAEGNKAAGTLVAGETVKVKEGTIFDVTRTIKS